MPEPNSEQTIPDSLESQDAYDKWINTIATIEVGELLDIIDPHEDDPDYTKTQVEEFVSESPKFSGETMAWVTLYHDVESYSRFDIPEYTIHLPRENPFLEIERAVKTAVIDDVVLDAVEKLRTHGYTVGGEPSDGVAGGES